MKMHKKYYPVKNFWQKQKKRIRKIRGVFESRVSSVGKKKFKKFSRFFVSRQFLKTNIVNSIIESCLDVVKVNPPRKPSRDPRRLASNSRSAVSPGTRSFMYLFFLKPHTVWDSFVFLLIIFKKNESVAAFFDDGRDDDDDDDFRSADA